MYRPGGFFDYYEGHESAGATQTGSHWVLAEAERAWPRPAPTFVLIANTGSTPVSVRVRTLSEAAPAGRAAAGDPGNARLTFPMTALPDFPARRDRDGRAGHADRCAGRRGSIYWHAGGTALRRRRQLAGDAYPKGQRRRATVVARSIFPGSPACASAPVLVAAALLVAGPCARPRHSSSGRRRHRRHPANEATWSPRSQDGRFVAFLSFASNLVPGDTNGVADIFLRDRDTDGDGVFDEPGAVSTIRVSQLGTVEANGPSFHPVVTPDGRYVFFESAATNFYSTGQPPLPFTEVLRWDWLSGAIVLVSRNDAGEPLNARSFWPARPTTATSSSSSPPPTTGRPRPPAACYPPRHRRRRLDPVAVRTSGAIDRPSVSGDGRVLAYGVQPASPTGGIIVVQAEGEPERVFPGAFRQVSHDGAFLSGIRFIGFQRRPRLPHPPSQRRTREVGGTNLFSVSGASGASPSGRYVQGSGQFFGDFVRIVDGQLLHSWGSRRLRRLRPVAGLQFTLSVAAAFEGLFAIPVATFFDNDEDGLNDHWELLFGLSPFIANGTNGDNGPAATRTTTG